MYTHIMSTQVWKQPPLAKIYEALGAIADGRVILVSPISATVASSSGDKKYTVEWAEDFSWMGSNDNASFWQGYLGYPMIAVLLTKGRIPYVREVSQALMGIPWKVINTKYKNNYDQTINEVLEQIETLGGSRTEVVLECERIQGELAKMSIMKPKKSFRSSASIKNTLTAGNETQDNLL